MLSGRIGLVAGMSGLLLVGVIGNELFSGLQLHPIHAEVEQGIWAGMMHHLSGIAHLLVMFAIGLWAVILRHRAAFWLTIGVVSALTVGSLLGRSTMVATLCQAGMILSIIMLGALIAGNVKWPLPVAVTLVSVLSLFHGYGHGFEYAGTNGFIAFIAGLLLSSVLSLAAGFVVGTLLNLPRSEGKRQFLGAATVLCGAGLVWLG